MSANENRRKVVSGRVVKRKKKFTVDEIPIHPLTGAELVSWARKLGIQYFRGVFLRDNLPKRLWATECAIINLDSLKDGRGGTHWVCYKKRNNSVHYFDSFGNLRPPLELTSHFKGCNVFYNFTPYQTYDTVICGHLCLRFLTHQL